MCYHMSKKGDLTVSKYQNTLSPTFFNTNLDPIMDTPPYKRLIAINNVRNLARHVNKCPLNY